MPPDEGRACAWRRGASQPQPRDGAASLVCGAGSAGCSMPNRLPSPQAVSAIESWSLTTMVVKPTAETRKPAVMASLKRAAGVARRARTMRLSVARKVLVTGMISTPNNSNTAWSVNHSQGRRSNIRLAKLRSMVKAACVVSSATPRLRETAWPRTTSSPPMRRGAISRRRRSPAATIPCGRRTCCASSCSATTRRGCTTTCASSSTASSSRGR